MDKIEKLDFLETAKDQFNNISKGMMANNGDVFVEDLFARATMNRSVMIISGFCEMMKNDNFLCAAPLVRLHLDSLLQLYALWIVESPHNYVMKKMAGKQTNNLKDKEKNLMRDGYLKKKFIEENKDFEWIDDVYKETSKFVHFSDKHIFSNIEKKGKNNFSFTVSNKMKVPEKSEKEIIDCMIKITEGLFKYLVGWVETKRIGGEKRETNFKNSESI